MMTKRLRFSAAVAVFSAGMLLASFALEKESVQASAWSLRAKVVSGIAGGLSESLPAVGAGEETPPAQKPREAPKHGRVSAGESVAQAKRSLVPKRNEPPKLDIMIEADRDIVLGGPTEIVFQITVTNNGIDAVKDIVIAAGDMHIHTIDAVAPGETVAFVKPLSTSGGEQFQFTATAEDSQGKKQAYHSNVFQVASRKIRMMPSRPASGADAGEPSPCAPEAGGQPALALLCGALPFVAIMLMLAFAGRR